MNLKVGQTAPEFSLPDQVGVKHNLADYRGRWLLVYFYPTDDTPGCTTEACGFRDNLPKFHDLNAQIVGISVQDSASHSRFATKYKLPFTLLADTNKTVVNQYGVWAPKKLFGREFLGTKRTSFLIDPEGKIAKIYENVRPITHPNQVIKDLNQLIGGPSLMEPKRLSPTQPDIAEKVYELTRAIPKGKVATYKQLAQLAGISNPRQVGHIMHLNPYQGDVPCHRVVSSTGKVAVTFAFGGGDSQQKLLENEGVEFVREKINLSKYLWNPFNKKTG